MTTSTSPRFLITFDDCQDFKYINRDLPALKALHQKAIAKHCSFQLASHHPLEDYLLENGKYYPLGFVIFDQDSLKIWSVPNLLKVGTFIRDRVL